MSYKEYAFDASVWLYPGKSGWYFISVPKDISADIHEKFADRKRGWGSIPINVKIGNSSWKTSIFPDSKSACFLLPIKSEIRKAERILVDESCRVQIEII